MPVVQVEDGMRVEPGRVHIIVPAKTLLISTIAMDCGFSDVSYFHRLFSGRLAPVDARDIEEEYQENKQQET